MEDWMRGRKAKHTAYLTKEINKSHDQRSGHMSINKRSETDPRTIKERMIGNRSKKEQSETDQRKNNRKPIKERTIGNQLEYHHDHYLTIRGKDN